MMSQRIDSYCEQSITRRPLLFYILGSTGKSKVIITGGFQ